MKDVSVGGTMSGKGKYREIFNYDRRVNTRSGNWFFYISNYLKDDIQYRIIARRSRAIIKLLARRANNFFFGP